MIDLTKYEVRNAIIERTMLGIEDHGIMTCWVYLSGPGWGCGFGGNIFDSSKYVDGVRKNNAENGFGVDFIRHVLEVVGVEKWEDLKGKHVRAALHIGYGVPAIGHFLEDKWFCVEDLRKEFYPEK